MRVTVLTGGATAERAVAFASASQIVAALRSRGHEVSVVDTAGGLLDERGERELLGAAVGTAPPAVDQLAAREQRMLSEDRKSTRLNSSHSQISYAVFCLKKKQENEDLHYRIQHHVYI